VCSSGIWTVSPRRWTREVTWLFPTRNREIVSVRGGTTRRWSRFRKLVYTTLGRKRSRLILPRRRRAAGPRPLRPTTMCRIATTTGTAVGHRVEVSLANWTFLLILKKSQTQTKFKPFRRACFF
jgi:hypothetical protein